jgi:hypothetical protein
MRFPGRFFPLFFLAAISAWAGPPFLTDDPEPVEYHHWEFYVASIMAGDHTGLSGTAPHVEINFGAFPETQLHAIVPMAFSARKTGASFYGPGDIESGVKYRIVKESSRMPQIGVFPLVEIPVGNTEKQLGAGNVQIFLPLWLQKSWDPWTTYGGFGYLVDLAKNPANSWFVGWEAQRDLSKFITVGAEIFDRVVPSSRSDDETGFTIGGIVNFSDNHHFLFSWGRDFTGDVDILLYGAYQITF